MMFSSLADLLTLLATTLFPIFASYKALKQPTPIALAPWLTFYATVSAIYLLESTVLYPLSYLPLYAWARLAFHLYLLLPAPEGATRLYTAYLAPFLQQHEADIEIFVARAHEQARAAGVQSLHRLVEWVRVNVLGREPAPPPPPPLVSNASYMQQLLSRFYGQPSTAGVGGADAFGPAVASLLQWAGSGKDRVDIPAQYDGSPQDRLFYLRQNMESLSVVMQAFAREENKINMESSGYLPKTRSETEFDRIERDEVGGHSAKNAKPAQSSGWLGWVWGSKPAGLDQAAISKKIDPELDTPISTSHGSSSGVDLSH